MKVEPRRDPQAKAQLLALMAQLIERSKQAQAA